LERAISDLEDKMAKFELNSDSEAEEVEICKSKINNCFVGFREESDIDS
jgi:hypothetical protein